VQYFAVENAKRQEPTNTGREPGLKGMGSRKFNPPPTTTLQHTIHAFLHPVQNTQSVVICTLFKVDN